MSMKHTILALGMVIAVPTFALAQGTIPGAERGIRDGNEAAGPVGGIVGGAVGAATGTVGGIVGGRSVDRGCETHVTKRENGYGDTDTVRRTNCP